jgi:uncharacterized protein (DUF427 family)
MSLTTPGRPLSAERPGATNYEISGPERLLLLDSFPRRVRALLGDTTVLDTTEGMLLHESSLLPVLYVPDADLDESLLVRSGQSTHCPYKGDATYWSVRTDGRLAEDAVWAYLDPLRDAAWLRGRRAVRWDAMDRWFDEDEEVFGHLRDPYHRVDVRSSGRSVRVRAGGTTVAETGRAKVLSETGLPNRWYLPRDDVRAELTPSDTSAVCPYKGTSAYWSVTTSDGTLADAAWSYAEPLDDAARVAGHVCFAHEGLTVEVG